ncbi:MAG: sensor histidine kinase [Marinilabiliaceae bacterium]
MEIFTKIAGLFRKKRAGRTKDLAGFFSSRAATELVNNLNKAYCGQSSCSPLETLALTTAKAGNAAYTMITSINFNGESTVKALSGHHEVIPSSKSAFQNPLCGTLLHNKIAHSNNCQDLLQQVGIFDRKVKNVTAVLITDNENTPIGTVFGFSKSQTPTSDLTNALRFFAINISSELRHMANREKLETKNRELLRTEEELKLKNKLLDNLNKNISKAKQVVDESSRLKSAFLANLSHEIRTPMNVIMGFTELLSADNMPKEQRRNYIDIIQQNGTRLLHIMDSLIDISRFQAKNIGKDQQAFPLNQLMDQLLNTYKLDIEITGKPLKLSLSTGAKNGEDEVMLDKEATFKILNHLLDNAVKFTASGYIHFGYEISEKNILFFVEDTGIGLPEGKEKEIFDLFRQGDLRLSRQYGGTGLGLAIAKRYATAMNGQIWCSNKEKTERGTIFKFTLPYKNPDEINSAGSGTGQASAKLLHTPVNHHIR